MSELIGLPTLIYLLALSIPHDLSSASAGEIACKMERVLAARAPASQKWWENGRKVSAKVTFVRELIDASTREQAESRERDVSPLRTLSRRSEKGERQWEMRRASDS